MSARCGDRCKKAGIIAAAIATTFWPRGEASAFEVKHAESGDLVRWHSPSVSLVLDRSVDDVPGASAALVDATEAWSHVGGAPKIVITDHDVSRSPGYDGKNVVFYDAAGFEPASGEALAVTVLSFDSSTGAVLDADIVLNGKYRLGLVEDETTDTYDVNRVIAHEMGHALGLSDELGLDSDSALMYPYVPRDKVLAKTPASDDVAGLETLYADNAALDAARAAQAKAGCQVGGAGERSGVVVLAGFTMALLVAAARRRKKGTVRTALSTALLVAVPFAGVGPGHGDAVSDLVPAGPWSVTSAITGTVTAVTTTEAHGLFESVVEVCEAGACSHVSVWGGTVGGITQMIGGTRVPTVGERVRLAPAAEKMRGAMRP